MGTTTERLAFLLSLDSQGAVQGFQDVGKTAEKELKKADDGLDKTARNMVKFGAGALAFGGTALVALGGLAKISEDANLSTVKLNSTIANQPQLAGANAKAFTDLAQSIQKKTAADGDDIVAGEAVLGQFGATQNQIMQLTPLVVDYARKMGVDLATAATDVGKALEGKTKALVASGVQIDANIYKTDRFAAITQGLNTAVGGFAEEEGKKFSARLESLRNQLHDVGETAGTGAVKGFESLLSPVVSLTGRLNEMNPAIVEGFGQIGVFGAATISAVGGISLAAGQLIKMRERFTQVTEGVDGASRSLNNYGKLGVGVAVAAGAVLTYNLIQSVKAMDAQAAAAKAASLTNEQMAASIQSISQRSAENVAYMNANNAAFQLDKGVEQVRDLKHAFDELVKGNAGIGTLERFRDAVKAAGGDTAYYDDKIQQVTVSQKAAVADAKRSAEAIADTGDAADAAAPSLSKLADAVDLVGMSADQTEARMHSLRSATFDLADSQRKTSDGWTAIDDAAKSAGGSMRDTEADMRRVRDASEGLESAQRRLIDAEDALTEARKPASARTQAQAERDVTEAKIKQAQAIGKVGEIEAKIKAIPKDNSTKSSDELAKDNLDLALAKLDVKKAYEDEQVAAENLTAVMDQGNETTKAVKTAEQDLVDAQRAVRDATEAVGDAQKAAVAPGQAHEDKTKAIADAYEAQKKNIWDTVEAMKQQGQSQQEIDAFIETSGGKLDEYATKYKLAKDDVDKFKDALDILAITMDDKRLAAATAGNYVPPVWTQGGGAGTEMSANSAEHRITTRVVVPLTLDKKTLAEAIIDVERGYN